MRGWGKEGCGRGGGGGGLLPAGPGQGILSGPPVPLICCRLADAGHRVVPVIRFVGAEDGLLSHSHDGPRMWVDQSDYLYYNSGGKKNELFRKHMAVLLGDPRCSSKEK